MLENIVDMKYFDIYYLCHLANNSIGRPEHLRIYDDFFENQFIVTPENFSRCRFLNDFCTWFVELIIHEEVGRVADDKPVYNFDPVLWLIDAAQKYKKLHLSYPEWNAKDNEDYYSYFESFIEYMEDNNFAYTDIIDYVANEMEYILFQNRSFLLELNMSVAIHTEHLEIKRASVPEWVKRAVFHRDRGSCVFCKKDLSGLLVMLDDKDKHFDHMVPLDAGGINDVCNLQLSCKECNIAKSTNSTTSTAYQNWY